jgi:hypothetical protein
LFGFSKGRNQSVVVAGNFLSTALPQLEIAGVVFKERSCLTGGASCTRISFDIDEATAKDPANYAAIFQGGPKNATVRINDACKANATVLVTPLAIATVTSVSPSRICAVAPTTLTITGSGFNSNPPASALLPDGGITLGGLVSNCANDACTTITANTTAAVGNYIKNAETKVAVGVTNGNCTSATPDLLSVVPQPVVSSVKVLFLLLLLLLLLLFSFVCLFVFVYQSSSYK